MHSHLGNMKITVLTYVEEENSEEHDEVVPQVSDALRELGHDVSVLAVHGDVEQFIRDLREQDPDLVFNMMESFGDTYFGDVPAVGLVDLLEFRRTGGGPGEFYITGDKALTKKILAYEKIPYPRFALFSKTADFETGGNLRMPLFVKPVRMDASLGIDSGSLVHDAKSLMKRVSEIHDELNDDALAEEFIEGRELYVGIIGNEQLTVLPPIEMDFTGFPDNKPRICDAKAKWDKNSPEYRGTKSVIADIPDELRARLQKTSLEAYRALRVRDYGRVDLRLAPDGEIYVIEVNASCYLEKTSELAMAAKAAGIEYLDLIKKIVELAVARYENRPPRSRSPKLTARSPRTPRDSSPKQSRAS
jgi:D-alanine-D-alanine ligase